MAITCNWENPLGTCYSRYDEEKRNRLTIYGGGNCMAIITDESKNLLMYFIDNAHFKAYKFCGEELTDIVLFADRKKETKSLMACLYDAGFEFLVKRTSKEVSSND